MNSESCSEILELSHFIFRYISCHSYLLSEVWKRDFFLRILDIPVHFGEIILLYRFNNFVMQSCRFEIWVPIFDMLYLNGKVTILLLCNLQRRLMKMDFVKNSLNTLILYLKAFSVLASTSSCSSSTSTTTFYCKLLIFS